MWIPKKLKIKNFRSIIDDEFNFNNGKTYLLQGVNMTDEGFESNGSGKSSYREALSYVLGLPIFAATLVDIINDNAEETLVEFEAYNNYIGKTLSVLRTTPRRGSSKLQIMLNEENQKDYFSTVSEGDKLIIEILGLPKEDILNHFIISKEKFISFFSSSDNAIKDLINRFSGANKLDGVADLIQKDIDEEVEKKKTQEAELNKLHGRLGSLEEDLEEAKNKDSEKDKSEALTSLNNSIGVYTENINNLSQKVSNEEKTIKKHEGSAPKLEADIKTVEKEIEKVKGDIKKVEDSKESYQVELNEIKGLKREVDLALKGAIECPKCTFEFNPADDINIDEARKTLPELKESIQQLEQTISEQDIKYDAHSKSLRVKKQQREQYETELDSLNREIKTCKSNIESHRQQIKSKEELIESTKKEIESVKDQKFESHEKEIKDKIKITKKEIKTIEGELQSIDGVSATLVGWQVRFKRFRSYLANKSLFNIQGLTNLYLQQMNTNLNVQIEGFKQNKDGSIREKITPIVMRDGVIEGTGSYKKYSGGERARIDIAITLAMRYLINQASKSGGFDLFWIDEITEGTDSLGIENIAQSINELKLTSIITSHVQHEKNYEYIYTAIKEKSKTKLIKV